MVRLSSLGGLAGHHSSLSLHSSVCGREAESVQKDFHSMKPLPLPRVRGKGGLGRGGQRELSTYRSAGVQHSQETRGTHKKDTKQKGMGEGKAERGRG